MVKPIKRRIYPDGRSARKVKFKSGIYEIAHYPTGRKYVGSSAEVEKRIYYHVVMLNRRKHHCAFLQNCWSKYGESQFDFFLLEECEPEDLESREQFHIDRIPPRLRMNSREKAGNPRGWSHSAETRRKMSEAAKRVASDPEERKRRSERAKAQHATGNLGKPKSKYPGV